MDNTAAQERVDTADVPRRVAMISRRQWLKGAISSTAGFAVGGLLDVERVHAAAREIEWVLAPLVSSSPKLRTSFGAGRVCHELRPKKPSSLFTIRRMAFTLR